MAAEIKLLDKTMMKSAVKINHSLTNSMPIKAIVNTPFFINYSPIGAINCFLYLSSLFDNKSL